MKSVMTSRMVAAVAVLSLSCVAAAGESAKPETVATARCQKDVRDYLEVLQFIRSAAGPQVGSQVAAGYVDEKTVREIQDKKGTCAAAELIRAKTGPRRG